MKILSKVTAKIFAALVLSLNINECYQILIGL